MSVVVIASVAGGPFGVEMPWWALLLSSCAVLFLVHSIGGRWGRGAPQGEREERASQVEVPSTALLGLLGLMLGFAFTIAADRFAERKQLVLDDANAISTTYLRAQTMPEPQATRVQELLRDYVGARVSATSPDELPAVLARSAELHREIWAQAVEISHAHPDYDIVSTFLESLNDMIDLHESRLTMSLYYRLPPPIFWTLGTVAILSIGLLGYTCGLRRWRALVPSLAVILAVSSVLVLIVELDRPVGSLFPVNQGAMRDLQRSIAPAPDPGQGRTDPLFGHERSFGPPEADFLSENRT